MDRLQPTAALREKFAALWGRLGSADFEERSEAQGQMVALGPAFLPILKERARDAAPEQAAQLQELRTRILFEFDGFLPEGAELKAALDRELPPLGGAEGSSAVPATLQAFAQSHGIQVRLDPRQPLAVTLPAPVRSAPGTTYRAALAASARSRGLEAVSRGEFLLVTSPEVAARLRQQRHVLDWGALKMDREEAAYAGGQLSAFFPDSGTQLHTGSQALSIQADPQRILHAARLAALLDPASGAVHWPAPPAGFEPERALAALQRKVTLRLNGDDPLLWLADLRKEGVAIWVRCAEGGGAQAPFPEVLRSLAPMTLRLADLPLGLALRWYVGRCRFIGAGSAGKRLEAGVDGAGRIELRVEDPEARGSEWAAGGADLGFLAEPGEPGGPEQDRRLAARLLGSLGPALELFPDLELSRDLRVIRGRLLVQGSQVLVATVLEWVGRWRDRGRLQVGSWRKDLEERLAREVEWDGRGQTPATLLPTLGSLGGCSLLLEDAPGGQAAHFTLTRGEAQLLAPGRHPLRALLDELARRAQAEWALKWGVVTLTPLEGRKVDSPEAGKF